MQLTRIKDNPLDPSAPRVGEYIFPPPTPGPLRQLKAANFAFSQIQRVPLFEEPSHQRRGGGTVPLQASLQASVPWHAHEPSSDPSRQQPSASITQVKGDSKGDCLVHRQNSGDLEEEDVSRKCACTGTFLEPSVIEDTDAPIRSEESSSAVEGQQEFEELSGGSNLLNVYDPLKISFTMLRSSSPGAPQGSSIVGGEVELRVLRQIGDGPSARIRPKSPSRIRDSGYSLLELYRISDRHSNSNVEVDLSRSRRRSAPVARSTAHRHVRLVDGTIFTPECGENASHASLFSHEVSYLRSRSNSRSSVKNSWEERPRDTSALHGWLSRFQTLFTKSHQNKQRWHSCPHIESDNSSQPTARSTMPPIDQHLSHQLFPPSRELVTPSAYNFALDGAVDTDILLPPLSPINLNKQLPPYPTATREKTQLSIRTDTPSLTFSEGTTDRPSAASTASSKISAKSSKEGFRSVTRGLINSDMVGHFVDFSPLREPERSLDPAKYDPLKTPNAPPSYVSYQMLLAHIS